VLGGMLVEPLNSRARELVGRDCKAPLLGEQNFCSLWQGKTNSEAREIRGSKHFLKNIKENKSCVKVSY